MDSDFEWRVGQDAPQEKLPPPEEPRPQRPIRSFLLLVVVGVGLVGAVAYWLVELRARAVATATEGEVLAAHDLVMRAAEQQDAELFRIAISGLNPDWTTQQTDVIAAGAFVDRSAFGLRAVPGLGTPTVVGGEDRSEVGVILSTDLLSAEVHFSRDYWVEEGDGPMETVALEQTAVYRRGERKWLLAPPLAEFWGSRRSFTGAHLTVTYPERDQEVARRLAADLDQVVRRVCREFANLRCPQEPFVRLRLDSNPGSLLGAGDLKTMITNRTTLSLPTPTLVGLPGDEPGYKAVARGYANHLVPAVIAALVGYECCPHGPFMQALLAAHLQQLGLQSWPLTEAHYRSSPGNLFTLNDISRWWFSEALDTPSNEIWPVYALVEFLAVEAGADLVAMAQRVSWEEQAYWDWLQYLTGGAFAGDQALEQAWLRFVQVQTGLSQADASLHPKQDLLVACSRGREKGILYRYRSRSDTRTVEHELNYGETFLIGLPEDDGVVIAERALLDNARTLFLWQAGAEMVLTEGSDDILPISWLATADDGEQTLLLLNRRSRRYGRLSVSQCRTAGDCAVEELPAFPIWSPDGSQVFYLATMGNYGYESRFDRPILLGGIAGEIIGTGKAPFWLDNETVVFISDQGEALLAVDSATLSSRRRLLSTTALNDAVESSSEAVVTAIEHAAIDPGNPDHLLVVTSDGEGGTPLFTYDLRTGEVVLRAIPDIGLDPQVGFVYRYSPDGRWLTISGTDFGNHVTILHLYDLVQEEMQTYSFSVVHELPFHWLLDWSADGQWLSMPDNGNIRLISPTVSFQRFVIAEGTNCTAAAWVAES